MLVAVFVLALALNVSAQYGQQTPAPSACPQGMIATPAYGTTCYNGGFYYKGVCCSIAACPNGQTGTPPVGGVCPAGTALENGVCCAGGSVYNPIGVCEVSEQINGPCISGGCSTPGYACDAAGMNCCPVQGFDYKNIDCLVGPAVGGLCPAGYVAVFDPNFGSQVCADLDCVPGVCPQNQRAGSCQDGGCPVGFTCYTLANVCCASV